MNFNANLWQEAVVTTANQRWSSTSPLLAGSRPSGIDRRGVSPVAVIARWVVNDNAVTRLLEGERSGPRRHLPGAALCNQLAIACTA